MAEPVSRLVRSEDGVELYVEVDEPAGPVEAPALVFVHGLALTSQCWRLQRRDLRDRFRLVLYDQRSHGRSGRSDREHSTIEQLGADLLSVLDAVAPDRPVVVVGHSLGGMTIMALAEQRPDLFGDRIVGVGLLATSAGDLTGTRWSDRAVQLVAPGAFALAARAPGLVETGRAAARGLIVQVTRRLAFGGPVPASCASFVARMHASTPLDVVADFYPGLGLHDRYAALAALRGVPTLVLGGTHDRITPAQHTRQIADRLPAAELCELPGAGHMMMLERPDEVTAELRSLLRRTAAAAARP